jgi:hypothetical protein
MHVADDGDPRDLVEGFLLSQLAATWDGYRRERTPENRKAYLDA